jgi:uncharacterized protein (DUF58 family)
MRRALGVVLAGGGLTLCAFLFDAAPLFVVGPAIALLGIASAAWVGAAAGAAGIEREGLPPRILEGQAIGSRLRLARGPLGLPGATVIDELADGASRGLGRGLHRIAPPSLILSDPFGIASAERRGDRQQQLLVLPRVEPIRWGDAGGARREAGAGAPAPTEPLAAVDVDGLRPYRQGTPASRIHWPALARGAGLIERRLRADTDARPLIVLDARTDRAREHLDAAVRAAASLTLELARAGGCRLLLPGERRAVVVDPDLVAWPAVHARLAMVDGGPDVMAPRLGADRATHGLIYVSARAPQRPPAAATVMVIPGTRPNPLFEVAGCRGFAVGARARRRAA